MTRKEEIAKKAARALGGRFSATLGIEPSRGSGEVFKWFLAAKLFGARIGSNVAERTYREFERRGVVTPEAIIETGWNGLVEILDSGGYVRYDFSTATRLLEICGNIIDRYGGDLDKLHNEARDEKDLEKKLKDLGKGIGDVTVNIFLREMRGVWKKATPPLSKFVLLAASNLGLLEEGEEPIKTLKALCRRPSLKGVDLRDLEAALLRLGKDYCKKKRCGACPLAADCPCRKER